MKLSEGRGAEGIKKGLSIIDKPFVQHNTQKEIAKTLGWSTGKVATAEIVLKKATPEIKEKLENKRILKLFLITYHR